MAAVSGAAAAASHRLNIGVDVVGPNDGYYGYHDLQSFLRTISLVVTDAPHSGDRSLSVVPGWCAQHSIPLVVLVPGDSLHDSQGPNITYSPADPERLLPILTKRFVKILAKEMEDATANKGFSDTGHQPSERSSAFICYRRDDTQDAAGRLHDRLVSTYGDDRVFMDIDSVPLGIDFVEHVNHQLAGCSAVIVLVGQQWLAVKDKRGRRRLELEDDLVRAEIAVALQRKIPVIPVLVQDAEMPSAEDLSEDIRPLSRRNGIDLTGPSWRSGVERLIKELDRVMAPKNAPTSPLERLVYDSSSEPRPFESWTRYSSTAIRESNFDIRSDTSNSAMVAIRALGSEAVGINLSLRTLVGRVEFTYRVYDSQIGSNHLFVAVIPMQETGIGRSGLVEVGSQRQDDPANADSTFRHRYLIPPEHYRDHAWHTEQTSFDLRAAPKVFYSILAPRINEGCQNPGPAELHISRVRIFSTE